MDYTTEDLDKVLGFKTWTDKQKMDELLRMDCALHCALGTDSTKGEREAVKRESRKIYKAIKTFDEQNGEMFLRVMDLK